MIATEGANGKDKELVVVTYQAKQSTAVALLLVGLVMALLVVSFPVSLSAPTIFLLFSTGFNGGAIPTHLRVES